MGDTKNTCFLASFRLSNRKLGINIHTRCSLSSIGVSTAYNQQVPSSQMIPPFQELMLPILDMYAARDSESIANREFMETLAAYFHLTEADRNGNAL